jgi:hypothetical protein
MNTLRTIVVGPVSTPAYSVCGQIRLVARQSDHYVRTRLKLHKGRKLFVLRVDTIHLLNIRFLHAYTWKSMKSHGKTPLQGQEFSFDNAFLLPLSPLQTKTNFRKIIFQICHRREFCSCLFQPRLST